MAKSPSKRPSTPTRLLNPYERGTQVGGAPGQSASVEGRAENWYKKAVLGRPDKEMPENMQEPAGMSLGNVHGDRMPAARNIRTRAG